MILTIKLKEVLSVLHLEVNLEKMTAVIANAHLYIKLAANASVSQLQLDGQELLNNLTGEPGDPDKDHSFYLDYHMNGKTINIHPTKLTVITGTTEMVHLAYTDDKGQLGVRYHFIVRGDDQAIYGYAEVWSNSQHPFSVNELRTVYRLDHNLFNVGYNAERIGHQPTSAHMMQGEKLQDETYRMKDGSFYSNSQIYSKYDYAGYISENPFWGQYGRKYGFWFIPTDRSYFPSGPLNQDLLLHYDGLILNYMTGSHFGTGDMLVTPGWKKFYGPWCIYLTTGTPSNQLQSVQARANVERTASPYTWLREKDYPHNLATVSGKVSDKNTRASNHYEVVLAKPSNDGTFMHQQDGYIYYGETDTSGHFQIDQVRPDQYTLYAYAKGGRLVGMLHQDNIQVTAPQTTNLHVTIPKTTKKLIWQIGESTHSTEGFKFSDQLRNHIWKDLVPTSLIYHVNQPDQDWYYLQQQGTWKILFTGSQLNLTRMYTLSIALAAVTQKVMTASAGTKVSVRLNGKDLVKEHYGNDSAGYRSALRGGNAELIQVDIPGSLFINGENVIELTTDGYVMYDTIELEQEGE